MIVNAGVESSSLVALKKSDGQEAWRLPGTKKCWGSPILVEVPGGKPEVVLSLAGKPGKIVSIDPVSGKELWSCEGNGDGYICPSVVYHDGIVYAVAGRTNHAVAVKAGGMGEVKPLWTAKASSPVGSPVYHDGYLYGLSEQAPSAIFCLEAATGKVMYSERINLNGHAYASAVYADGKIFYVPQRMQRRTWSQRNPSTNCWPPTSSQIPRHQRFTDHRQRTLTDSHGRAFVLHWEEVEQQTRAD